MPFQQVPVLDVIDDSGKITRIPQSHAIERYLAREFGLMGKNNLESARVDFLTETLIDIMTKLPWTEKDEDKKVLLLDILIYYHWSHSHDCCLAVIEAVNGRSLSGTCFQWPCYSGKLYTGQWILRRR